MIALMVFGLIASYGGLLGTIYVLQYEKLIPEPWGWYLGTMGFFLALASFFAWNLVDAWTTRQRRN